MAGIASLVPAGYEDKLYVDPVSGRLEFFSTPPTAKPATADKPQGLSPALANNPNATITYRDPNEKPQASNPYINPIYRGADGTIGHDPSLTAPIKEAPQGFSPALANNPNATITYRDPNEKLQGFSPALANNPNATITYRDPNEKQQTSNPYINPIYRGPDGTIGHDPALMNGGRTPAAQATNPQFTGYFDPDAGLMAKDANGAWRSLGVAEFGQADNYSLLNALGNFAAPNNSQTNAEYAGIIENILRDRGALTGNAGINSYQQALQAIAEQDRQRENQLVEFTNNYRINYAPGNSPEEIFAATGVRPNGINDNLRNMLARDEFNRLNPVDYTARDNMRNAALYGSGFNDLFSTARASAYRGPGAFTPREGDISQGSPIRPQTTQPQQQPQQPQPQQQPQQPQNWAQNYMNAQNMPVMNTGMFGGQQMGMPNLPFTGGQQMFGGFGGFGLPSLSFNFGGAAQQSQPMGQNMWTNPMQNNTMGGYGQAPQYNGNNASPQTATSTGMTGGTNAGAGFGFGVNSASRPVGGMNGPYRRTSMFGA